MIRDDVTYAEALLRAGQTPEEYLAGTFSWGDPEAERDYLRYFDEQGLTDAQAEIAVGLVDNWDDDEEALMDAVRRLV